MCSLVMYIIELLSWQNIYQGDCFDMVSTYYVLSSYICRLEHPVINIHIIFYFYWVDLYFYIHVHLVHLIYQVHWCFNYWYLNIKVFLIYALYSYTIYDKYWYNTIQYDNIMQTWFSHADEHRIKLTSFKNKIKQ